MFEDPDDVCWCWENLYKQVLDDHAPIKTFYWRPNCASKFISPETRHLMRERDKLKKTFLKSRNTVDWENYRQMRNKVVSMRRKAVQMHFKKLCDRKPNNQRKFWSTIKPYINSRKCAQNNSRIILKENDKLITDSQAVTETLNKYFTSITRTDTGMTRPIANNSCINNYIGSVPTLSLKKTNYREVKDILVKENKATGADLIPPLKCYAIR